MANAAHNTNVVNFPKSSGSFEFEIDNPYQLVEFMSAKIRESKMTFKAIAEKAPCSATTVSRIASHETKDPRIGTCLKILNAIGGFKFYIKW